MSRQIHAKSSLSISEKEAADRSTKQGKVLFTAYRNKECALLIQNDRLTAACFLSGMGSKVGAVYIGRVKNMVKNIDACFVEITGGEICFLPLKKADFPYLLNRNYDGRLVEGDMLLVQVERDAHKTKQASVTAHISLSNDYFVISMGTPKVSYSSKLEKAIQEKLKDSVSALFREKAMLEKDHLVQNWSFLLADDIRERLAEDDISISQLPLPVTGCIVRTKAADMSSVDELLVYFYKIMEQYARLLHTARYRSCFTCLKEAPSAVESALSSIAAEQEYQEIVTDRENLYRELLEYGRNRENAKPLRLYQDELLTLAKLYSIESKMEMALGSRVWLKSGGYLVIEPTEALTVIDVNSGKYEAGKGSDEAALQVNLEAAEEIALQLRLKNLSGIIIVDFINMTQETSRKQVLSLLKQLTARDIIKTAVVDMTPLGLVEITRKKIKGSLKEQFNKSSF